MTEICLFFYSFCPIYCFFILYIQKRTKNLSIPILVSLLSFINDGLFISQKKSHKKSNKILYYSYSIVFSLFNQSSLAIRYNKLEDFHFSRMTKKTEPSLLDLRPIDSTILKLLWCMRTNIFLLSIFWDLISSFDFLLILIFFFFLLMMKRHITVVTWHITWCEVIGLNRVKSD